MNFATLGLPHSHSRTCAEALTAIADAFVSGPVDTGRLLECEARAFVPPSLAGTQVTVAWFMRTEGDISAAASILRRRAQGLSGGASERMTEAVGVTTCLMVERGRYQFRLIVDDIPIEWATAQEPHWGELKDHYRVDYDAMERRLCAPCWRVDVRLLDDSLIGGA